MWEMNFALLLLCVHVRDVTGNSINKRARGRAIIILKFPAHWTEAWTRNVPEWEQARDLRVGLAWVRILAHRRSQEIELCSGSPEYHARGLTFEIGRMNLWSAITARWQHWSLMKSCLSSLLMRELFLKQNDTSFIQDKCCRQADDTVKNYQFCLKQALLAAVRNRQEAYIYLYQTSIIEKAWYWLWSSG